MTNLSLDRLRAVAGVFISESDFQVIQLEYLEYLKENGLVDSEYEAEVFCDKWVEEKENLGTLAETSDGHIKYYSPEGAPKEKITTQEFLNNLDMTSYHWENLCRSYWQIFKDILNTDIVDKQLLINIIADESTISHKQIYELQKAMKSKVTDLLAKEGENHGSLSQ